MKRGRKYGNVLGIKIASTSKEKLLNEIASRLDLKDKFYIVTPNPEIVLMASRDWLLKKSINRADFSIPDGVGLKFAYKLFNPSDIEIIKGRELFLDILKIANEKKLKVYLFGGKENEAELALKKLEQIYKNVIFKTSLRFPKYNHNGQPKTEDDRKLHKKIIGSIKLFEPELIFVGLGAPRQEKWIYRNFFRLKALGAMSVGGTFRYIAGLSKLPPEKVSDLKLEWLWRVLHEPKRAPRVINAVILFPLRVLIAKLFKEHFKS